MQSNVQKAIQLNQPNVYCEIDFILFFNILFSTRRDVNRSLSNLIGRILFDDTCVTK